MGFSRKLSRTRLRRAYDMLGKRWKDQLRSQSVMDDMGISTPTLDAKRVGRKPPISVFSLMVRELADPVAAVGDSSPREFLEYAAEFIIPDREHGGMGISWRGAAPRFPASEAPSVPLEGIGEEGGPGAEGEVQAPSAPDGTIHDRAGAAAPGEE